MKKIFAGNILFLGVKQSRLQVTLGNGYVLWIAIDNICTAKQQVLKITFIMTFKINNVEKLVQTKYVYIASYVFKYCVSSKQWKDFVQNCVTLYKYIIIVW